MLSESLGSLLLIFFSSRMGLGSFDYLYSMILTYLWYLSLAFRALSGAEFEEWRRTKRQYHVYIHLYGFVRFCRSLEMTFGPIPSELLAEGAETHRYYQRSSDGLYSLTRSLWDAEVRGCNLKDLKPVSNTAWTTFPTGVVLMLLVVNKRDTWFLQKALPEECITPTAYDLETYEIERQEFLDLIGRMLAYKDRISSDEALKHPFLTMQNLLASNLKRTQHVQRTLHLNSLNNMAPPIPLHYTKLIFN